MKLPHNLFGKKALMVWILAALVLCQAVPFSFAEESVDQPAQDSAVAAVAEEDAAEDALTENDASVDAESVDSSSADASLSENTSGSSASSGASDSSGSTGSSDSGTATENNSSSSAGSNSNTATNTVITQDAIASAIAALRLSGTVTLEGKPLDQNEFTIELKIEGGDASKTVTVKNDAQGKFDFLDSSEFISLLKTAAGSSIDASKAGTVKCTISQKTPEKTDISDYTIDPEVYSLSLGVSADSSGKPSVELKVTDSKGKEVASTAINFNNKYTGTKAFVQIEGKKTLEGKDLKADEFSFLLKDSDNNEVGNVKNDAQGKILFNSIAYDQQGTWKYKVSEGNVTESNVTRDSTVYDVTVTVSEGSDGKLSPAVEVTSNGKAVENKICSFVNKYNATKTSGTTSNAASNTASDTKASDSKTAPASAGNAANANKTNTAGAAKTGDSSGITFYVLLLAAFAAVLTGIVVSSRRKKGSRD